MPIHGKQRVTQFARRLNSRLGWRHQYIHVPLKASHRGKGHIVSSNQPFAGALNQTRYLSLILKRGRLGKSIFGLDFKLVRILYLSIYLPTEVHRLSNVLLPCHLATLVN